MVLWNYSWLWPPLKILFTSLDPRQGAVSGTNLAAAQSAKHAKVQTLPMVQQNQDPFSFLGIVSVRQCMMALFTHNLVHANSKFPRLHDFLHWSNGQKVGQSGWASGHDLSILNSSYMYILIPPKWQDKISKSGTPRADEIFGCDTFGVLFKLYSLVLYATENGTPVYSATLNITAQRMVKQMQTQRDAYKTVYDELLKFQEDNCSLEAPSEPWHCVHSWQQKHMWFTLTLRHPLKSFRRRYLRRKAKRSFERFT